MTDALIDRILDWRAPHYNSFSWTWGTLSSEETGVWLGAGGLPDTLCTGSVKETASSIMRMGGATAIPTVSTDRRAKDNIPGIMRVSTLISKERLLSVIADPGGTHRPTPPCKRMRWDLCDGSLRAVALALAGIETVSAFFVKP